MDITVHIEDTFDGDGSQTDNGLTMSVEYPEETDPLVGISYDTKVVKCRLSELRRAIQAIDAATK